MFWYWWVLIVVLVLAVVAGLAWLAVWLYGRARKPPKWNACTKASCWHGANASQRMMNVLSPYMPEGVFKERLGWMKSRGVNTAHVFLANTADGEYASPGYSVYGPTCSWKRDAGHVQTMLRRIAELRRNKLAVVVWLFADDSTRFNREAAKNFPQYLADVRAAGLLDDASLVVAGLELDEYFSASQVSALVRAIRGVWSGKVGVHQTSGRLDYSVFGDVAFYQVNPGRNAEWIESEARRVCGAAGKPVAFFELSRQEDRDLCQAAFRGGAYAVGNW